MTQGRNTMTIRVPSGYHPGTRGPQWNQHNMLSPIGYPIQKSRSLDAMVTKMDLRTPPCLEFLLSVHLQTSSKPIIFAHSGTARRSPHKADHSPRSSRSAVVFFLGPSWDHQRSSNRFQNGHVFLVRFWGSIWINGCVGTCSMFAGTLILFFLYVQQISWNSKPIAPDGLCNYLPVCLASSDWAFPPLRQTLMSSSSVKSLTCPSFELGKALCHLQATS